MTIYELASVCRSKNAGPFQVTIDLMFADQAAYERVMQSPQFTVARLAAAYRAAPDAVAIKPFARLRTIKVVLPRAASSGSPDDRDVYGSQQHFPLGAWEI